MTQPQHTQQSRKVELAPNQIYVKRPGCENPVQTLIEGAPGWSFHVWKYTERVSLYYKGRYVASLISRNGGTAYEEVRFNPPVSFSLVFNSLAEATQHYARTGCIRWIEEINRQEGLEDWCISTSFTFRTRTLHLSLPPQECERLERIASLKGATLEQMAMQALYSVLPELESMCQIFEESGEEVGA